MKTLNTAPVKGQTYEFCRARSIVKDGNIDKALSNLKKKCKESNLTKEIRERMQFVKSSAKRRQEIQYAKIRNRKQVEFLKLEEKL